MVKLLTNKQLFLFLFHLTILSYNKEVGVLFVVFFIIETQKFHQTRFFFYRIFAAEIRNDSDR